MVSKWWKLYCVLFTFIITKCLVKTDIIFSCTQILLPVHAEISINCNRKPITSIAEYEKLIEMESDARLNKLEQCFILLATLLTCVYCSTHLSERVDKGNIWFVGQGHHNRLSYLALFSINCFVLCFSFYLCNSWTLDLGFLLVLVGHEAPKRVQRQMPRSHLNTISCEPLQP